MARASVFRRVAAALVPLAIVAGALVAAPAHAAPPAGYEDDGPVIDEPGPAGPATEATIIDMIDTSGLYGGTVPSATATTPYPSTGLQKQRTVTTAQIVLDDPGTPVTENLLTYCIDLDTDTTIGVHYELGTWSGIEVENLPYVQWILNNYYPKVPASPVAGSTAEKVRAVQGAIWYFTDQFVVNRFYPTERNAVRAIVQAAQAAVGGGTSPAPPRPTITVTPSTATAAPGEITGPYTVGTADLSAAAVIDIPDGTEVFRDAAATPSQQVLDGAPVADGDQLWTRFDASAVDPGFVVEGYGSAPAGNVYEYDQGNPPRTAAQKLVLAADAVVPVRAGVTIIPAAAGSLQVDVEIAGAAAGSQGEIGLQISCLAPGWSLDEPAYRIANAPAGRATVAIISGIPVGATCAVTQPEAGANDYATLASTTAPLTGIAITAGDPVVAAVVDTYDVPAPPTGSLQVDLEITGPAAGDQDALVLLATCTSSGGDVVIRSIPVAAGATGESTIATLSDLPAGAECAVTQTDDGSDDAAQFDPALSSIAPASVVIADGETAEILVTNYYQVPAPPTGTLAVDLTVGGAAAGEQSEITLLAVCTIGADEIPTAIVVPAGAIGTTRVAELDDVTAGSVCTVEQSDDGANSAAVFDGAASSISPASVTIVEDATALVTVTDVYAVPAPTPTPTPTPTPSPTHAALPATGSDGTGPWPLGILALLVGAALVTGDLLRRRAKKA